MTGAVTLASNLGTSLSRALAEVLVRQEGKAAA